MRKTSFTVYLDPYSGTLLHAVCLYTTPIDAVSTLLNIGGKALVIEKNKHGCTPLHYVCRECGSISMNVLSKLVEVGGKELLMEKDGRGYNSLQIAFIKKNESIEVLPKFLAVGGKKVIMAKNNPRSPQPFLC